MDMVVGAGVKTVMGGHPYDTIGLPVMEKKNTKLI